MRQEGAILQLALFEHLQANDRLIKRYAPIAEADVSPQFSYDGMRSQWFDRALSLTRHLLEFSVWHAQAAFADGDNVSALLIDTVQELSLAAPNELMQIRLQAIETGFDASSRLWRQQLEFDALLYRVAS